MTLLRTILPAPITSGAVFVLWLVLARSAQVADVAFAVLLAFLVPIITSGLRIRGVVIRKPLAVVRFVAIVFVDALRSGAQVGRGLLAWRTRRPHLAFVTIPLDLRSPVGLSVLAMVTTVVPGTVWSELAVDRSALLLHVWDVPDEARFIAFYKARYEQPLRGIFE
jgi:multicomponent K+:H+ antiporter subunit E